MAPPGVEKLLEEVQISSTSFLREELLSALSSEDLDDVTGDDFEDSELDDFTSLSLSDLSLVPQAAELPLPMEPDKYGANRGEEIEQLKRANKQQMSALQFQLDELRHQNDLKEIKLQHFSRKHDEDLQTLRSNHAKELHPALEKIKRLERQLSVAKDGLLQKKEYIVDGLRISDAEYEEIRDLPEESRDLRQAIAFVAWDRIADVKRIADGARRETEALRDSLSTTSKELENVHLKWDEAQKAAVQQNIEHSKTITDLKNLNSTLQSELDHVRQEVILHEDRSKRCEEAEAVAVQAKASQEVEAQRVRSLEEAVQRLEETTRELRGKAETSEQIVSVLELDKQYLTKENAELGVRCEQAESKVERKALKAKDAARAKDQLEQQLLQQQTLAAASSEERMQAEVAALRHRSEMEIAAIKKSTAELYERQNLMLVQARDEALASADRLEAKLEMAVRERDQAVKEHAQLAGAVEGQVGEARSQVRVKAMELERLQVAYEDGQAMGRQLRLESEMFREKLEVLRGEYHALHSTTASRIASLEAELAHARTNAVTLDAIESNLNLAVDSMDASGLAVQAETEAQLLQLGAGLPSEPHRRLTQTMFLARKVVTQQRELTELKQTVQAQEETINKLTAELKDTNKLLENTSQPHELLVTAIRGRDEELAATRQTLQRVKAVLAVTQKERDELREQCARLKHDVEQVVAKRGAAEGLQHALAELQTQQKTSELRLTMLREQASGPGQGQSSSPMKVWVGNQTNAAPQTDHARAEGGGGLAGQAIWFTKLKARNAATRGDR